MELVFEITENYTKYSTKIFLLSKLDDAKSLKISEQARELFAKKSDCSESDFVSVETVNERLFFVQTSFVNDNESKESLRTKASQIFDICKKEKIESVLVVNENATNEKAYAFVESMYLTSYVFDVYKSEKSENPITKIACIQIDQNDLTEIIAVSNAVFAARNYINEPIINFSAETFANEIETLFANTNAKVSVYDKAWIEKENMGGLLAVNKGSIDEPRFVHIEWNPVNSTENPIVLVGKGVVFDTGGLSLKPSGSMETMKADMGGAAAVVGVMKALVELNVSIKIEALLPITDNRPGGNAYAPGDVIKMRSGLTVEVLNTDAEGRMILADALDYAKQLNPKFVVDLATLTGAANMTVGENAAVIMGTASQDVFNAIEQASLNVWEPLVRLPLWNFYEKQISSDIADIKNVGGPQAGSITAGKFLQKFTDYPWVHIDLSGSSFLRTRASYKGIGGTAFGVRSMYQFFKSVASMDV